MQNKKLVLTYFNLRGTTQVIRNLMEYLEQPYQQKILYFDTSSLIEVIRIFEDQKLPNLKDGDFTITQIVPICKYLCRISNREDLLGKNLRDQIQVENMILDHFKVRKQFLDVFNAFPQMTNEKFGAEMQKQMVNSRTQFFPRMSKLFKQKDWIFGYLTLADFFVYQIMFYIYAYCPQLLANPELQKYMVRFQSISQIDSYFKSDRIVQQIAVIQGARNKLLQPRKFK